MEIVLTLPRPPLVPLLRGVSPSGWGGEERRPPQLAAEAIGEAGAAVAEALARVLRLSSAQPGNPAGADAPWLAYDEAAGAVERGETGTGVRLLHGLLANEAARPEALMGLAICAARLALFDEALVLAIESRRLGVDHPRAWCVAGLCALKRDKRRIAQTYLAAAARSARRSPDFGDDLRAAQRLLLLMHMSQDHGSEDDAVRCGLRMRDLVMQDAAIDRSGAARIRLGIVS